MTPVVRAKVKGGRLVLDEPTTVREEAEVALAIVDGDELDQQDRERLHAALDSADDELRSGKGIAGEEIISALRAGRL
jgi:hypothetical protein